MADSIASKNIFDLLQDDAPDAEVSFNIVKPAAPKQTKPVAKPTAAPTEKRQQAPRSTQSVRGSHRGPPRDSNRDFAPREQSDREFQGRSQQGASRSRGQGGRGRPRGAGGEGRRAYDRHSATGLHDSEKKTKQGWMGDDQKVLKDGEVAAEQAVKDAEEGASTPAEPVEPEDTTKTLEEYLKEKMEKVKLVEGERKETRKANEGVDSSVLKATSVLVKEDEQFFVGKGQQKAKKQTRTQREKVAVEFTATFAQPERQRRGPRNEARGGRGGNTRGQRRTETLNVNDESAFPSLG
ncbi:hypothetical protein BB559_003176 [Furculomyces boomerangus]|uniref:Hyaluronan/mRNA-binding protein domain-containing protein n=2 Tax=Harpellales TaxID=61421 RepID=A0A2T9YNC0_9FUNG|nr:hypothetical protein BB559_003176 [Furculomyces boomerangus]PVZ99863.1 hypothetical protein BB558_004119 [Smittium angustum]